MTLYATILFINLMLRLDPNSTLSCFYTAFSRLRLDEQELTSHATYFFETVNKQLYKASAPLIPGRRELIRKLSGSLSESSSFARFFKPSLYIEYEVDNEEIILTLPDYYRRYVRDHKSKQSFVSIHISSHNLENCNECINKMYHDMNSEYVEGIMKGKDFVIPYVIKKSRIHSTSELKSIEVLSKLLFALIYHLNINEVETRIQEKITKSSYKLIINIRHKEFSFDIGHEVAFLIKIKWRPKILESWIAQKRNWPDEKLLSGHTDEGYIIAKTSQEEKLNKSCSELRYSFSHLERKITSLRSTHQNVIYLIFKSTFYLWLHDEDYMPSFIAKTVMFWTCEEYPPDHKFWDFYGPNSSIIIKELFSTLLYSLKKKHLPYYFVPEINILDDTPNDIIANSVLKIQQMIKDIKSFIPNNAERVFLQCQQLFSPISYFLNALEISLRDPNAIYGYLLDLTLQVSPKQYIAFIEKNLPSLIKKIEEEKLGTLFHLLQYIQ